MKRKYNFKWSGYKYAPETIGFFLNGKHLNLPEETRTECNKIDLKHYRSVSIIRRSIY